MHSDVTLALTTPYASPLIFRTEVRRYLYLASAGLVAVGCLFIGFDFAPGAGWIGAASAAVGVFMLFAAWVNFWAVRAGYPHLILVGHWLTERSSDAFSRDLDLSALGETKIVILTGSKGAQSTYLGFLPLPGAAHTRRNFVAPKLQPFAATVLLNGYVGNNVMRAKDIERVINARREQPKQDVVLAATTGQGAARLRLIATAVVFVAVWVVIAVGRAMVN